VTDHNAWLRMTKEEPIDPLLPICDAHHHLWDYPEQLPEDRIPVFVRQTRRYLLKELLEDIAGGHNIVQTVHVQCGSMYRKEGPPELRCIGETEFVQGIAAQSASGQYGNTRVAAGIVGHADLTMGSGVAAVLEAHLAASPNRFRGIRDGLASNSSVHTGNRPHLMADPKFREGFACLHKYGLSFEAWLFYTQLGELTELARAFPDTTIILNHVGTPLGEGPYAGKHDEVFLEWKNGIKELSSCSNVLVKLGGLGMSMTGFGWHTRPKPPGSEELARAIAPYFRWCIDKFGVNRCMFESNFPVDNMSYSYTVIWNCFKLISRDFTASEKSALFHDTAVKAYRLS
jgi:L-fuconolactonase